MKTKIICLSVIMLVLIPIVSSIAAFQQQPSIPIIYGPKQAKLEEKCNYSVTSIDPQGDDIYFIIRCSDDPTAIIELGPYPSGANITFSHCWCNFYQDTNPFVLRVKSHDGLGHESDWGVFETKLTNTKVKLNDLTDSYNYFFNMLERILQRKFIISQIFDKI